MPLTERRRPWAVFDSEERVRRVSMGWTEWDAWIDFLGWATPARVDECKAKGFRAVPVNITEAPHAAG